MWVLERIINDPLLALFVITIVGIAVWALFIPSTYESTGPDKPGEPYYEQKKAEREAKRRNGIDNSDLNSLLQQATRVPPMPKVKPPKAEKVDDGPISLPINF